MSYTQTQRRLAVDTPLGKDVLMVQALNGEEGISHLFHFTLDLVSTERSLDFDAIVGRPVSVRLARVDGSDRHFSGIVSRFSQGATTPEFTTYRAEVVPWTWLLTRTSNCRVFQHLTVPAIIEKVFHDRGFSDFRNHLQRSYPTLEYCVQYRESDFAFVSRLMEQHGIFYYFEHDKSEHFLVMADTAAEHRPCPGQEQVRYQQTQGATIAEQDVVTEWWTAREVRTSKYSLTDYNFETPGVHLDASVEARASGGRSKLEVFDYPGRYGKRDEGEGLVRTRIEEEEAQQQTHAGTSNCMAFQPGYRFTLSEHERDATNQAYVLTAVSHAATEGSYTSAAGGGRFSYSTSFRCIPASVPFRPVRSTSKPVVDGVQSAVVVGKKGETMWVDKYGRVKVQFHWDRAGQRDENSSCWVRVAQSWAGKAWGSLFLPRIGQEVLVQFLDGDPDRPIIVGSVYNAEQTVPYSLPDMQLRSAVKSNSKDGGSNEFRLDDKDGAQQVYLHAEKDLDVEVKNDRRESIGGSLNLTVAKDRVEQVDGAHHVKVAADRVEEVGANQATNVAQEFYLKAGTKVVIEAGMEITLKGAGGFVKIDPSGVTVQGTMVLINSGGSPGTGTAKGVKAPETPKR